MMINANYADIVSRARANNASHVNFDQKAYRVNEISAQKDTVTLSDAAQAKMNGTTINTAEHTYAKPKNARTLLAENKANENDKSATAQKSDAGSRFDQMMQSILDKRLGVDREKLKEIEAMMEEIANDENLSAEQKQKALEELEKVKEKIIEESLEIKELAKRTFTEDEMS